MSKPLRVGSLCSGYGGIELGLLAAGVEQELAFVADPDPAAAAVLAAHHPRTPNLGDITALTWSQVPAIDVLTAGFPCQDVSTAGRRAGIQPGNRSGLWLHIAQAIDTLRPSAVLVENVRGLLSAPAALHDMEPCPWCVGSEHGEPVLRALGAVLGTLADLGYDAAWTSLPAAAVGAAHLRWRVFLYAWPAGAAAANPARLGHRDTRTPGRQGIRPATVAGHPPPDPHLAQSPAPAAVRSGRQRSASDGAAMRPSLDMIGDLLPTLCARDWKAGGHDGMELALLPTPAARDGAARGAPSPRHAARRAHAGHTINLEDALALLPTPRASDATKGGPNQKFGSGDLALSAVVQPGRWGAYAPAIARWESVLGRPAPHPTEPGTRGGQRLSPRFVEWLIGLPDGHVTAHVKRGDALRLLGNGVVPQQLAAALPELVTLAASTA